jgi:hypothetical protein
MDDLHMEFIHADERAIKMANDICAKFFYADECTTEVEDNLQGIHCLIESTHAISSISPCTRATQAIYAERGSREGSVEYEKHKGAQT